MEKWSVVACDQFTSQPEYWHQVEKFVEGSPSALNIILPEVYLTSANAPDKITQINNTMHKYLEDDLFECYASSFIYVERTLSNGKVRNGLVGTVDLEAYDYTTGSKSRIRATEETVLERIPPRVNIRRYAQLELPHILLLIDDADKTVIEPFESKKLDLKQLYNFELMQGGGRIAGYHVPFEKAGSIADALLSFENKSSFLYAMGDGNHSLATAKECWEQTKRTLNKNEQQNHPARFALVELVNLHNTSFEFEPIHRVIFDCNPQNLLADLSEYCNKINGETCNRSVEYIHQNTAGNIDIKCPKGSLALSTLQNFLDEYIEKNNCSIDYIHGVDVVESLASKNNVLGFILPAINKNELFTAVAASGALPRKTFSIGHANEKRYYLECRKITAAN
ncbi:MAG: DUF1015 domain-containing protein [Clostridiaceae bacterium]|nr:DUF1015 domain-containing protein [Clostridiaceae bacterium]